MSHVTVGLVPFAVGTPLLIPLAQNRSCSFRAYGSRLGFRRQSARSATVPLTAGGKAFEDRSRSARMRQAVIAACVVDQAFARFANLNRIDRADEDIVGADLDDLFDTAIKGDQ